MPKKGYKFSKTRNENISKSLIGNKRHLGKPPWNKGKKGLQRHTDEWKEKQKKRMLGNKNGFTSENMKGNRNPNWKGGITKINHLIRTSFEYRLWVKYCMERDNFICQDCEIVGGNLEVHHMKSIAKIIKEYNIKTMDDARKCEELWHLDNGITLCEDCHIKFDSYRKRRKNAK